MISDAATAAAVVDPVRAQLLAELTAQVSATELVGRIGLSRQKVNYHLRRLTELAAAVVRLAARYHDEAAPGGAEVAARDAPRWPAWLVEHVDGLVPLTEAASAG